MRDSCKCVCRPSPRFHGRFREGPIRVNAGTPGVRSTIWPCVHWSNPRGPAPLGTWRLEFSSNPEPHWREFEFLEGGLAPFPNYVSDICCCRCRTLVGRKKNEEENGRRSEKSASHLLTADTADVPFRNRHVARRQAQAQLNTEGADSERVERENQELSCDDDGCDAEPQVDPFPILSSGPDKSDDGRTADVRLPTCRD